MVTLFADIVPVADMGAVRPPGREGGRDQAISGDGTMIVGLASVMFIALFGWGAEYFGWSDPYGRVQWALFSSFVLGILAGYKTKS
ncbi:hypothetical protein [Sphingomicrobium arenosum]|uniref:hypothetical protein n=1 Tax=Sphingomicrobium arenosum TaxID=2233861 RepID=UPI0022400F1A|nr:hypothetical protein [Sphingomicrobium arenosum]